MSAEPTPIQREAELLCWECKLRVRDARAALADEETAFNIAVALEREENNEEPE